MNKHEQLYQACKSCNTELTLAQYKQLMREIEADEKLERQQKKAQATKIDNQKEE